MPIPAVLPVSGTALEMVQGLPLDCLNSGSIASGATVVSGIPCTLGQ